MGKRCRRYLLTSSASHTLKLTMPCRGVEPERSGQRVELFSNKEVAIKAERERPKKLAGGELLILFFPWLPANINSDERSCGIMLGIWDHLFQALKGGPIVGTLININAIFLKKSHERNREIGSA
jgi:hypothetical protein